MARWHDIRSSAVEVTAPSAEPLSTAEGKSWLRVDHSAHDTLIGELIAASRQRLEHDIGRSLITTTWDLTADAFPDERAIPLPRLPVASITSVTYYSEADASSTLAASAYLVDTASGRLALNDDEDWPTTDLRDHNAVVIRFVAGYGAASTDVPQPLRLALYRLLALAYDEAIPSDRKGAPEREYDALIAPYRAQAIG